MGRINLCVATTNSWIWVFKNLGPPQAKFSNLHQFLIHFHEFPVYIYWGNNISLKVFPSCFNTNLMQKINLCFEFQKIKKNSVQKSVIFIKYQWGTVGKLYWDQFLFLEKMWYIIVITMAREGNSACFRNLGMRGGGAIIKNLFF